VNLMTAVDTMDRRGEAGERDLAKYFAEDKPGYYPYLGMAGAVIFVDAPSAQEDLTREKLIKARRTRAASKPAWCPPRLEREVPRRAACFRLRNVQNGKLKVLEGW